MAEAFRRARRHSRLVGALKVALPLAAVLIALAFAAYSFVLTPGQVSIDIAGTSYSDGKLTMAHPKLDGFTRDNRPYSMTAARAVQEIGNTDSIELQEITASLPVDDENWATVKAERGIYDRRKNTLDIAGDMTVTTADGMTARLRSARVDIATGSLATSEPVDITMQGSHIDADTMRVEERGKVLVFETRVRVTVTPERKSGEGKPGGAERPEAEGGATDATE